MEGENVITITSADQTTEVNDVIIESEWQAVQGLYQRGYSKKRIARELELDVKTVRKWIGRGWQQQLRPGRKSKLDQWEEFLRGRASEVDYNAMVLYREIKEQGYDGCYQSLVKYLRPWRRRLADLADPSPRFETEPGKQSQVDWGSTAVWLGEQPVRVHLFVMVLGYSRRIFARGYSNERMDSLLDGHQSAFDHFGGRTASILYDNPRTIVVSKDEKTGQVQWNPTFKDRMDFYGVEVKLCRYYRARTKGKVESGVKYVKRNALAGKRFNTLEELNQWLIEWCLTVADQRVHGTTGERPADRFQREERAALIAVDERRPTPRERCEGRVVASDAFVTVETNRYPVPVSWVGQQAQVRILPGEVIISITGQEPISYQRLEGKHQIAPWKGEPRKWESNDRQGASYGPPKFDPRYLQGAVQSRPLTEYQQVAEEVGR